MKSTSILSTLLLLISFAIALPACNKEDSPVAAIPTPTTDARLLGSWYAPDRQSLAAGEGFQIGSDNKVFRLIVDQQNRLQYDSSSSPGQFSIQKPGYFTFTFSNPVQDTVLTYRQVWAYEFSQNDSALTIGQYAGFDGEATYIRTTIGQVVK